MSEHDERFACLGTTVRLIVGPPTAADGGSPGTAAARARAALEAFDRRLSRFRADSELTALNADPRPAVPASPLLCAAVAAARWAAEWTGGLLDPTLVDVLEGAGYRGSRAGTPGVPLADALASAPRRRPAAPDPRSPWGRVHVDRRGGVVRRPPGVRLDLGGTGKGLAADRAAALLAGHARFAVDCGGDVRFGGPGAVDEPFEVEVVHPLTRRPAQLLHVGSGAVATSGLDRRVWALPAGGFAHHLIDPATRAPAWTGLVGATALAPTALEADVLAKLAVLSGPDRGRAVLRRHGGVLFHDDGSVERVALPLTRAALRAFGGAARSARRPAAR